MYVSEYQKALRTGDIKRAPICQKCNKKCKTQGHHTDYLKPLEVIWLCSSCHAKIRTIDEQNKSAYLVKQIRSYASNSSYLPIFTQRNNQFIEIQRSKYRQKARRLLKLGFSINQTVDLLRWNELILYHTGKQISILIGT